MWIDISHTWLIAIIALIIERFIGYPKLLLNRFGHPVEWIGGVIGRLNDKWNNGAHKKMRQRLSGVIAVIGALLVVAVISIPLTIALRHLPYSMVWEALLATPFLAQKELRRYVAKVADGLATDLESGRSYVRHIVGRDPANLDETGVVRAAIESLAENSSDAVVAPALWLSLFGLPGIIVYKTINTMDSMIGHKDRTYRYFGWAAARLDDLVNLPASRLTAFLYTGVASLTRPRRAAAAMHIIWRDAGKHASPNAGWPEAAMAGILNIRLGGPRQYGGEIVPQDYIGDGRYELDHRDIQAALRLYGAMITLMLFLIFTSWLFL